MIIKTIDEALAIIKNKTPIVYDHMNFLFARNLVVTTGTKGQDVISFGLVQRRERADGLGYYETIVHALVEKCEVIQQ